MPQGKIRLTAPTTYGERIILPLINDFLLAYPDISIEVNLTNHKLDLVEHGFDLAIRIGQLLDSTMIAKPLTVRRNYLCASPAYLKSNGTPNDIDALTEHACLLGSNDHWRFTINGKIKSLKVAPRVKYNSGSALSDAALKGIGVAQLPGYYVEEHLQQGTLVSVLDEMQIKDESVWAIYPHNRQLSPKVKLLVEYLTHEINK